MTAGTARGLAVSEAVAAAARAFREARVFFVCTLYGSTGSFFLYSLLDGHPDLFTFPFDIRRIPIHVEDFASRPREAHVRAVMEGNDRLFDTAAAKDPTNSLRYLGDGRDQGLIIDRARFGHYLTAMLDRTDSTVRQFTLAVVMAYNFTRNVVPLTNTFVLYTHDLGRTVTLWRRQFGAAGIVAACRHPVNVYASSCHRKRFEAADRRQLLAPYALTDVEGFVGRARLLREASDDVGLVPIEELHANPRRSMEALAAHLGIRFTDSLLQSTIGGLKWWGSHQRVGTINGFSRDLHATIAVDFLGRRAERMVWRSTEHFQRHVGYAQARRPARWSSVGAVLWPKVALMFYRDMARSALALLRSARSVRARAVLTLRTLKLAARYVGVWSEERRAVRRLAREDAAMDYAKVIVITPLSSARLRWPGAEGMRRGAAEDRA